MSTSFDFPEDVDLSKKDDLVDDIPLRKAVAVRTLKGTTNSDFSEYFDKFKTYFDLEKKTSTKTKKTWYPCTCVLDPKDGYFKMNYKIYEKKYYVKFNMKTIKSTENNKKMFRKFFIFNEEKKRLDSKFVSKEDLFYYEFQFYLFRAVLCVYLFEKNEDNSLSGDMNLFTLCEDTRFIELVEKLDVSNKCNFYGLM